MIAIEQISIPVLPVLEVQSESLKTTASGPISFSSYLADLNAELVKSESMLNSSVLGEGVPPQELLITMETAKLQLQLAVEVRNRLVESYQEVMRMQV